MSLRSIIKIVIHNIIVRGTLNDAMPRNHIYKEETTLAQRKAFREYLARELECVLQDILRKKNYTDQHHYRAIASFSGKVSRHKTFRNYLEGGQLKIGTAQKLINLYWKMNWLLKPGIKAPLHCPFDSIIIRKLDRSVQDIRWTRCDNMDDYKRLVAAARRTSGRQSIAE